MITVINPLGNTVFGCSMDYLIGTGGWAYFNVEKKPALKAYSELFNFVEVNCTFYEYPKESLVETWRQAAPSKFIFSIRCHHDLTHRICFKPSNEAYEVFYKMKNYCRVLKSPYLVLETPTKYVIDQENVRDIKDFFFSTNLRDLRLVWEYRAPVTDTVTDLLRDLNIIQAVDLSNAKPAYNLDVTYSRLFGKGKHNIYQFDDDELAEIDQNAQDTGSKTVILAYHGHRMYSDATRHIQYKKTGKFMQVTSSTGLESAEAVLREDANFPVTKSALVEQQGWKVIDLTAEEHVHLSKLLLRIPDKTYFSLNEVINQLGAVI